MKIPEMILFDYGQTLVKERFDPLKGTEAVLKHATKNKYHLSAEQVQAKANEINRELGRFVRYNVKKLPVNGSFFQARLYITL